MTKHDISNDLTVGFNCIGCDAFKDGSCPVTPQATEGPFYVADAPERRDISEDCKGIPLALQFLIVGQDMQPIKGARVDIWHCDADGIYSGQMFHTGYEVVDTMAHRYLRGYQFTDAEGVAAFDTIYPGWYQGRTTHIHAKVQIDGHWVLNAQMYLPDALNEFIYTQHPDYVRSIERDTINALDQFREPTGYTTLANLREHSDRYSASLTLVVDPEARAPDFKPITTDKIVSDIPALPRSPDLPKDERLRLLMLGS